MPGTLSMIMSRLNMRVRFWIECFASSTHKFHSSVSATWATDNLFVKFGKASKSMAMSFLDVKIALILLMVEVEVY